MIYSLLLENEVVYTLKKAVQFKRLIVFFISFIILALHTALFGLVWYHFYNGSIEQPFFLKGNWLIIVIYAILLFVFSSIYGAYKIGYLRVSEVVYSQFLSLFFVNFITYCQISLIGRRLMEPAVFVLLTIADMMLTILWAYFSNQLYFRLYPPRKMLIVYGNKSAVSLVHKISTRSDKYQICASIDVNEGMEAVYKKMDDYESVIICDVKTAMRNTLLKYCFSHSIRAYVTPKISDIILQGSENINLFDTPLLLCRNRGLTFEQRILKRSLDLFISSIGFILTSPVMLVVAIAIKAYDHGPVLFKQKRCTLNGKVFSICKFRSMIVDAEKDGVSIPATEHDPRITPIGRFIRKTRIDELPQLLNILSGDMSIVGPRPERVEHVMQYTKEMPEFDFRLKVKGGLTGYAQIFGKYNTTAYDKLKLDLMYIENYSFLLDLKLILMTIKIIFMKESTEGFTEEASAVNTAASKQSVTAEKVPAEVTVIRTPEIMNVKESVTK